MTARDWLIANDLIEVSMQIDEIIEGWKSRGVKTRRNWWLMLAGTEVGNQYTVEGYKFPILGVVRSRFGLPPTDKEVKIEIVIPVPPLKQQNRWKNKI